MSIKTRTVYYVRGEEFDDQDAAVARLREVVAELAANLDPFTAEGEFGGGLLWETDTEVPATRFDELINEYGYNIHGVHGGDGVDEMPIDRNQRFLLVEENTRGGYWLTTGDDAEDLIEYSVNQEFAEEWMQLDLIDLQTGESVPFDVSTTVNVTIGGSE